MRRLIIPILALGIVVVPLAAWAADFRGADKSYTLPHSEKVGRDLYVVSGTVTIHGQVGGDLFVAGGDVRVDGSVTGDVFAAGGTVTIAGDVGESVHAAGGTITIEGHVDRNLSIVGGSLTTTSSSSVAGDVDLAGGSVSLAGTSGPVQIVSGSVEVQDTAHIGGDLTYTSDKTATIATGSVISGRVSHHLPPKHEHPVAPLGLKLFWWLSTLASALVFLWFFPRKSKAVAVDWRSHPSVLLYGLIALIATPIVGLLLMITLVGAPLGVITFLLYLIALYLSVVVSSIVLGDWVMHLADRGEAKADARVSWIAPVIGVALLTLLGLIPFVGWLITFLIWLGSLGALIRFDWHFARTSRSKGTL